MATNLVSGSGVEVLSSGTNSNARVSGSVVEVLNQGANPNIRVTAMVVEVLSSTTLAPAGAKVRSFGVIII